MGAPINSARIIRNYSVFINRFARREKAKGNFEKAKTQNIVYRSAHKRR